jgi:DNA repair protein RadC
MNEATMVPQAVPANPFEVNPEIKPIPYRAAPPEFRALRLRDIPYDSPMADNPERIAQFARAAMAGAAWYNGEVEQLVCVSLSTRRRITGFWLVSCGTLDTILCHPREVFRTAVLVNAASLVLVHNHPSGDPTPSEADVKVTRDLIRAGQVVKIEVVDHVILGHVQSANGRGYTSLRELGYFYS